MKIWRLRVACCIPKTTNTWYTQTGCVFIITFPLQQWLRERVLILRYTYSTLTVLMYVDVFIFFFHRHSLSHATSSDTISDLRNFVSNK